MHSLASGRVERWPMVHQITDRGILVKATSEELVQLPEHRPRDQAEVLAELRAQLDAAPSKQMLISLFWGARGLTRTTVCSRSMNSISSWPSWTLAATCVRLRSGRRQTLEQFRKLAVAVVIHCGAWFKPWRQSGQRPSRIFFYGRNGHPVAALGALRSKSDHDRKEVSSIGNRRIKIGRVPRAIAQTLSQSSSARARLE